MKIEIIKMNKEAASILRRISQKALELADGIDNESLSQESFQGGIKVLVTDLTSVAEISFEQADDQEDGGAMKGAEVMKNAKEAFGKLSGVITTIAEAVKDGKDISEEQAKAISDFADSLSEVFKSEVGKANDPTKALADSVSRLNEALAGIKTDETDAEKKKKEAEAKAKAEADAKAKAEAEKAEDKEEGEGDETDVNKSEDETDWPSGDLTKSAKK